MTRRITPPGTTINNQGTVSYDSDGDMVNDTTVLTDGPGATVGDPTPFVVGAAPATVPTLSDLSIGWGRTCPPTAARPERSTPAWPGAAPQSAVGRNPMRSTVSGARSWSSRPIVSSTGYGIDTRSQQDPGEAMLAKRPPC